MKKALLAITALLTITGLSAQQQDAGKPPVSMGVTGGLNLAKFKVKQKNTTDALDYKFHSEGLAGIYFNIPLNSHLSLEPQVLFITHHLKPENDVTGNFSGRMHYLGLPLLLKIQAGKYVSFPVGIQWDILTNVDDDKRLLERWNFAGYSFGVTGGIEITPVSRISIFGRYVYGLNSVTNTGNDARPYDLNHQNIYAGLKIKLFDFGKRKVAPPPPPPPPKDTDGDGIVDSLDKCPTVPGLAKYDGCPIPDTDKDGINDEEDKCPTVPGLAKYNGCPIPDTDKDGINDEEDKCPDVPGVKEYQGCPVPDRDKDGIPDDKDKCPDVPGVASQDGCPEITKEVTQKIEYAAKSIYFANNSTKLLSKSYAALNDVIKILNDNTSVKLKIDGHTDSNGSDDYNMKLSEGRAASVKAYLVSKGVDESRLVSQGFGETMPIADNKTAAGRQKNRRVEMKLFY